MAERNAAVPEVYRIEFGINVGDIIIEESDIYGDGVNIAARLEGIAEPGGDACPTTPTGRYGVRSRSSVMIWDRSPSRILPSLCRRGGFC